jgi:hypothetical protein
MQNGDRIFIPVFSNDEDYYKSGSYFPMIEMYPESYIPILKNMQYADILFDYSDKDCATTIPKNIFEIFEKQFNAHGVVKHHESLEAILKRHINGFINSANEVDKKRRFPSLLNILSKARLIFPTTIVIPQSMAKDFANGNLGVGDDFTLNEELKGAVLRFEQDGVVYVPAFTDSDACSVSYLLTQVAAGWYPSAYMPILRKKQYDQIVINHEVGKPMFTLTKRLFEESIVGLTDTKKCTGKAELHLCIPT